MFGRAGVRLWRLSVSSSRVVMCKHLVSYCIGLVNFVERYRLNRASINREVPRTAIIPRARVLSLRSSLRSKCKGQIVISGRSSVYPQIPKYGDGTTTIVCVSCGPRREKLSSRGNKTCCGPPRGNKIGPRCRIQSAPSSSMLIINATPAASL